MLNDEIANKSFETHGSKSWRLLSHVVLGFACFASGYLISNFAEVKGLVFDQFSSARTELPTQQATINLFADTAQGDEAFSRLVGPVLSADQMPLQSSNSTSEVIPKFDRAAVLADFENRIGADFKIPEGLRERAGFWFDVYTKYDANRRIIHHSRFPWIVFKVVDVTEIINSEKPRFRWMRNEKADKLVKGEVAKVRAALTSLARKKSLEGLDEYEQLAADALSGLRSDVRKEARKAAAEVRVQTGQRNFFVEGLEVSPRYLGTMEKIFRDQRLPVELTRIPFVESSFNKHATSKVGASGIWQFMGNTGRKFMLVNELIDERRSPFKASEGAARLLKENHMILHRSWPLAITAWNHGPSGIRKAMLGAGSRDLAVIVSKYNSKTFDFASSNFYCEFLGALHAERYQDLVFGNLNRVEPISLQALKLPRKTRVAELLKVSGMSLDDFLILNPELKTIAKGNLPIPVGFRVHFPIQLWPNVEQLFADAGRKEREKKSAG